MLLLIPGPVSTHQAVRDAAAADFAPWDHEFRALYAAIRARVLALANGRDGEHTALPLQGCGHFATEAAVRTFVPAGGKLLVPMTGHYADRLVQLAERAGRVVVRLPAAPDRRVAADAVAAALRADPDIGHLGCVYSETSSGVVHDAPALAQAAGALGRRVIVDAVSAFGAMPFDIAALPAVDAVLFTANKCIEGIPGAAFAVARVDRLEASVGQAGSWSLDWADIHAHTKRAGPGTARFTPAAQALAAFLKALELHEAEGGAPARLARYQANMRALCDGVRRIGLRPCLAAEEQGPIIVNVHAPADPAWNLQAFVDALKRRGFLISNFFNTAFPSFRVGCIGQVFPADMARAVEAMDAALHEMGVRTREAATAEAA